MACAWMHTSQSQLWFGPLFEVIRPLSRGIHWHPWVRAARSSLGSRMPSTDGRGMASFEDGESSPLRSSPTMASRLSNAPSSSSLAAATSSASNLAYRWVGYLVVCLYSVAA